MESLTEFVVLAAQVQKHCPEVYGLSDADGSIETQLELSMARTPKTRNAPIIRAKHLKAKP